MLKKYSKMLWLFVLGFVVFSLLIGTITGNTLLAESAGALIVYALIAQFILYVISSFYKGYRGEK